MEVPQKLEEPKFKIIEPSTSFFINGWDNKTAVQKAEDIRWNYFRKLNNLETTATCIGYSTLPIPLLKYIFSLLDSKSHRAARCVCKHWSSVKDPPISSLTDEDFKKIIAVHVMEAMKQNSIKKPIIYYKSNDGTPVLLLWYIK